MNKFGGVVVHLVAFALFILFVCTISVPANAEEAFLTRSCNEYSSSRAFVRKSVATCLSVSNSRRCERDSQKYFERCGYEGDFNELSRKIQSELLTVIVLKSAPSLKAPAERKGL